LCDFWGNWGFHYPNASIPTWFRAIPSFGFAAKNATSLFSSIPGHENFTNQLRPDNCRAGQGELVTVTNRL
jgi:hypothetical protein